MADVDGYPVLDIYVDAVPPVDPRPRIVAVTPGSISFTWDPVADRGDGAGPDYFAAGMDHYISWLTVGSGPPLQRSESVAPAILAAKATPADNVCAHVVAVDKVGNATAPQSACGRPAGGPPVPPPPPTVGNVRVNPAPPGLAGLAAWFWLDPAPSAVSTYQTAAGVDYRVVAQPRTADWDFGDGARLLGGDFGSPYPRPPTVEHAYATESEAGYPVMATVGYQLTWWWRSGAAWLGPYPLGSQVAKAAGIVYPVRQAQPELLTMP